jgi:hypothetical protein
MVYIKSVWKTQDFQPYFEAISATIIAKTRIWQWITISLTYVNCFPKFEKPVFSSSTGHPGLAGIVKCCG